MKLLLVERHDSPLVTAGWVAHVGSANESYGITGMAHLFEHMIHKGTTTIGTKDWSREEGIMAKLDALRVEMNEEYSKLRAAKRRGDVTGNIYLPENQTERLAALRAKMKELQAEQKELIVKDEFDKVYTTLGASGLNAGTTSDWTLYFINVPANKLELWFWMESDRMLNPVFREFYSERDVVREERRNRIESSPTGKFDEQFEAMFWTSTPYHHPTIGWPSDVESINREEADRFFDTYYAPNNITAVLVGDFDTDQALALAKQYFGRIPRGTTEPPEVITEEIEQVQARRMDAEADTNPSVQVRWHTVPFVHKDVYALDLLAAVLNARTGRLYKSLVEDKAMAAGEPYALARHLKYSGYFELGAELSESAGHDAVEAALLAEIERIKKEPVGDRELQKVKNQSLADSFRRLQSNFFLLLQLLIYDGWGEWQYINESPGRLQAVTADDISRVANTYLTHEGLNVMRYHRKAGTEEDPEIAALPAQQKAMVKQTLAQIAQVEDADQLGQFLAMMQAQASQVGPDDKAAFELIVRRLKERIDELGATGGEEE
jgi:predicted Zn-dependent peptidase